jgi:multidrug efflux pump subunit AcrA (membrane-fusion protein)
MRRKWTLGLLFALIFPLVASINLPGCSGGSGKGVKLAEVQKEPFATTVSAIGKLEATDPVDVAPLTDCTIAELKVQEGDEVAAGDVLAVLDQKELELQAMQAKANYLSVLSLGDYISSMWESSQIAYSALGSSVEGFANLQAQVDTLVMTLFDLAPVLVEYLPPDQQEYVKGVLADQRAQYVANMSNRSTPQLPALSGYPGSALEASATQAELAFRQYQLAQEALQNPVIRAPVAGAVVFVPSPSILPSSLLTDLLGGLGSLTSSAAALGGGYGGSEMAGLLESLFPKSEIKPGVKLAAGQAAFQIVDLTNMRIRAEVEESDIPKIKKGQLVRILLDAYPEREFIGKVIQVGVKAETGSAGTTIFPVTIQMDTPDIPLRLGFNATVDIEVWSKPEAIVIPSSALLSEGGEEFVYVVEDGVVHRRRVVTGMTTDEVVEIVDGLEPGEKIVIEGTSRVKEGSKI